MKSFRPIAILLPAALVLMSGCATKGWVRETLDKKEAEINQRVETVDGKVTGVGSRVNTLEGSITEVSEAARGAKEASNAAQTKADDVDRRVTRLWTNRHNPRLVDTVQVFFRFDRADLDDTAQTALVNLSKDLESNPNLVVELTGYTDTRGPREYNYQLSQRRVEAVRRFLVGRGIGLSRILSVGLGPIVESSSPEPQKRRVTAKLMLEQD